MIFCHKEGFGKDQDDTQSDLCDVQRSKTVDGVIVLNKSSQSKSIQHDGSKSKPWKYITNPFTLVKKFYNLTFSILKNLKKITILTVIQCTENLMFERCSAWSEDAIKFWYGMFVPLHILTRN